MSDVKVLAGVLCAALFLGTGDGSGAKTGSWGEHCDGTYRNPVLNADYPDVDIERVADTYYLISSSMHYAPGMRAGFCHHSGQFVLCGVRVGEDGRRHIEFDHNGRVTRGPELTQDLLHVRTFIDGDRARYACSLDGASRNDFGPSFRLIFGRWKGGRLGFCCWNDRREAGHLDVDGFTYDYDGPK